jgi:hypothetical protein
MHREGTAPDDVIERGASLGQSPLHAGMGKIVLSGPVALSLDLTGRIN